MSVTNDAYDLAAMLGCYIIKHTHNLYSLYRDDTCILSNVRISVVLKYLEEDAKP